MNKKNPDHFFSQLLQNDLIGKPDEAIENRLMHSFLLKSTGSKLKQNSFTNYFGWLFSLQSIGLKAGLASVILFFSILNSNLSPDTGKITGNDSLFNKRILVADSTRFSRNIDSLRHDSLN